MDGTDFTGIDTGSPSTTDPTVDCTDPFAGGEFLGVVPFTGEWASDFGTPYGVGWDARLLYDLQRVEEHDGLTPNDLFYVRTEYPDQLDTTEQDWVIRVRGLVGEEIDLPLADLKKLQVDQGPVMMECSGNTDGGSFGLMSSATWSGVPLMDVLSQFVDVDAAATQVLVGGFDGHSTPSVNNHSTPGASWVFTLEQLERYGAFLAFGMNGVDLPLDHGFPVRLMVPRWWGCACIKWVNRIRLVDDSEPATSQMQEFASRTHQPGVPALARDFRRAAMQAAAMPVRVEKWRIDDRISYRVLGILWGGEDPTDKLMISFDGQESPVDICPPTKNVNQWSVWVHRFDPTSTGEVLVTHRVDDASVDQIRLDMGWYDRTFTVDEI